MTSTSRALMMSVTMIFAAGCGGGAGAGGQAGATGGPAGQGGGAGSGNGGTAGGCADAGVPSPDAPPPSLQRGEIRVIEGSDGFMSDGMALPEQPYTRLDARFYATHPPQWHTDVMTDGTCTLKKFVPSQCPEPFCDGVCLAGTCQPYTSYVAVGTVDVTGLKRSFALNPSDVVNYYYPTSGGVPTDLYDACATIGAHASGAPGFPAFDVAARGVTPLETAITNHVITLTPHADHVVSWTPSGDPGARVRLTLNANNHGHGQPYEAIIVCDAADAAGTITVPKAMIDAFPATANWQACVAVDCPRSTILRYALGVATVGDGWVGLTVGSELGFGVEHTP